MSLDEKFLPPDDMPEFHRPFWEALKAHELRVQRCDDCGSLRYVPKEICPRCGSQACSWTPVSGRGRVYTYTVIHRGPTPAYQADAPYVIAHVELDEGVRIISNLIGCDSADVRIGMPVEVVYEDISGDWTLFKFTPVAPAG
jgi:uncharacterized OB-fold protein